MSEAAILETLAAIAPCVPDGWAVKLDCGPDVCLVSHTLTTGWVRLGDVYQGDSPFRRYVDGPAFSMAVSHLAATLGRHVRRFLATGEREWIVDGRCISEIVEHADDEARAVAADDIEKWRRRVHCDTQQSGIGQRVLPRAWAQGFGLELAATPDLPHEGATWRDDETTKREVVGAWAHGGVLDVAEVVEIRRGVRVFTDPEIAGEAPMVEWRIRAQSGLEGWAGPGSAVDALAELERAHALAWEALQVAPGKEALASAIKHLRWRLEAEERGGARP